jgi:hypothetical protein
MSAFTRRISAGANRVQSASRFGILRANGFPMRPSSILAAAVPVVAALLIAAYTEPPIPRLPLRKLAGSIQYWPVLNSEGVFAGLPAVDRVPPPRQSADTSRSSLDVGSDSRRPERVPPAIATSEATAARPPRNARPGTCQAYPVPRTYRSMLSDVPKKKRKWSGVTAEMVLDPEGRITCIQFTALTPNDEANRRAMDSLLGWKFRPTLLDGKKVEVSAIATVHFHPKN